MNERNSMKFRKDSLLLYEIEIGTIIIAVLCLAMIPMLELELSLLCTLLFLLFVVLILAYPKLYNEFITIDETGISCHKAGKQVWIYDWDDIVKLQRSSRYRMPSVEIVVQSPCRGLDSCRGLEHARFSGHYFQLGRTAKKAIEQFYNPKENPLKQ